MNAFLWKLGCLNAGSSVIIAAVGGHKPWEVERKLIFNSSFNLHLSSSIGILLSSFKNASIPGILFCMGLSLFSYTSYYRCFTDNKKYNYLMPPGGTLIILAWISLALY